MQQLVKINYFVLGMKPKKQVIWTTHCKVMVKTGGTRHGLRYCKNLGAMEVWLPPIPQSFLGQNDFA